MKILISGGGTGGHVFPAIAIADAIKVQRPDADILFVGALGKIEMEKVPKAGYPIEGLWISGFHRNNLLRNLNFPFKLLSSVMKARRIVKKFCPDVGVGVGGYASGPALEVAGRMGVPILLQEQNGFPGVTNRLLAKRASKICVVYPGMEKFFDAEKIILTGNPVRQDIIDLSGKREAGIRHFGLDPDRPIILLFGGSLGARTFNQVMRANEVYLKEHPEVQVIWQMGKLYEAEYRDCGTAKLPNIHAMTFIDRMDLAYAIADVVISRAGGSVAELAITGKPSVLVPSPNVAEDHQTANAKSLVAEDAAILVSDAEAQSQMLQQAIQLVGDEKRRAELSANIHKLAKPNAAHTIAEEVLQLASKK